MFACKPACCGNSDPVSDTVKVDASKLAAVGKENAKPVQLQKEEEDKMRAQEEFLRQQQKAEERRQMEEEAKKRRQEEEARRRKEEEALRRRQEQETAEREAAERAAKEAAAAAARAAEQRRLEQEQAEQERLERERAEAAERAAQLEAQKQEEERLAQDKVSAWLKTNGFADMSTKKKSLMSGSKYALHEAVAKSNSEMVGLMLRLGVDKTLKNSKGQTAEDLAHKLNKNGSMDLILGKLGGNYP